MGDYAGLRKLIWKELFVESEKNCPTAMHFLVTLKNGNLDRTEETKVPPISLMHAILIFWEYWNYPGCSN